MFPFWLQVTQLERAMNVLVFVQFTTLLIFSAILAGLEQWWAVHNSSPAVWYLESVNKFPELPPGGLAWLIAVSGCWLADTVGAPFVNRIVKG